MRLADKILKGIMSFRYLQLETLDPPGAYTHIVFHALAILREHYAQQLNVLKLRTSANPALPCFQKHLKRQSRLLISCNAY